MATRPPTQSERIAKLEQQLREAQVALLELSSTAATDADLAANTRKVEDLAAKVTALQAKVGDVEPVPQPPEPGGSAPQIVNSRADVTRILLEELAKLTSYIPGGGDLVNPASAVQLHTTDVIEKLNALQVPEPVLRPQIRARWEMEVEKHKWAQNHPPKVGTQPSSESESNQGPTIIVPANPTGRWSRADIDRAVKQMTTPNEGRAIAIPDKEGWYRQGSVVMGVPPKDEGRPGWAPDSNSPDGMIWPYVNWWAVLFREIGDPGGGIVQIRNCAEQGFTDDWQLLAPPSNKLGWGAFYHEAFRYQGRDFRDHTGKFTEDGLYDDGSSFSVAVKNGTAPHFMCGNSLIRVPNIANLRAYVATCEARLDPRGNLNAKVLFQAGADAKPTTKSSSANGLTWYPGIGVASMQRVTPQWQRFSMITVEGAGVAYKGARLISLAELYAKPPLLT